MKKFLLSVLMCAGISGIAHAMEQPVEQPLDLGEVLETCPDQLVSKLDSKSFFLLTRVCSLFQAICDDIPMKNLVTYFFSDAADTGNKNLIDRFIAQPDKWMFEPGMEKEILLENVTDATIKIFNHSLGKELQNFLGDCSFYCVHQADKVVRCFWFWKSPETFENKPQAAHCTYFNIEKCDDAINMASEKCMNCLCSSIDPYFSKDMGCIRYDSNVSMPGGNKGMGSSCFKVSKSLYSVENFIKKNGMLMLLVLAAQKNNTAVVGSILNDQIIPNSWIENIVEASFYRLPFYNYKAPTVCDVLEKALDLRPKLGDEC